MWAFRPLFTRRSSASPAPDRCTELNVGICELSGHRPVDGWRLSEQEVADMLETVRRFGGQPKVVDRITQG